MKRNDKETNLPDVEPKLDRTLASWQFNTSNKHLDINDNMKIELWDKDTYGDDLIGSMTWSFDSEETLDQWNFLNPGDEQGKHYMNEKKTVIKLNCQNMYMKPLDPEDELDIDFLAKNFDEVIQE